MNPPAPGLVPPAMKKPLHTVRLSHTPTSITITLEPPAMSIEVRSELVRRRRHVRVYRPLSNGTVCQAGEFGSFIDPAAAMERAAEVAHILAIGLGLSALRGDVAPPKTLVPASHAPRTYELIEMVTDTIGKIAKSFRKHNPAEVA